VKIINLNNILIISFICFFFLSCSSVQLIDISEDDQLDDLLNDIGQVELSINTNEEVKQLIFKSMVYLDSDIRINFVDKIDNEVLLVSSNFLNQNFTYSAKVQTIILKKLQRNIYSILRKMMRF